jgi:hypothetical protein
MTRQLFLTHDFGTWHFDLSNDNGANMGDTLVTTILGSLGTAITLASVCIAYLQFQRLHARKENEVHVSTIDVEPLRHTQELPAAHPARAKYVPLIL